MKTNADGSCKEGYCGGGGVIKDQLGSLVFAYSLNLDQGTSNWAEAKAMLYGVQWCISNKYEFILAESDSRLLVNCVNDLIITPWRIHDEGKELKDHMENTGFILNHYREANKVADAPASMSSSNPGNTLYEDFVDLPAGVKGLMTMDRCGDQFTNQTKDEAGFNMGSSIRTLRRLVNYIFLHTGSLLRKPIDKCYLLYLLHLI